MMITSKGQITIPKAYREKLGLLPHTEVEFELVGNELRLKKVQTSSGRGQRLIAHMTTDEIMHLTRGE